jgi:hypothetical protein
MFILLIILVVLLFFFAFANHRFALIAIRDTLEELADQPLITVDINDLKQTEDVNNISKKPKSSENKLSPEARIYLEELKTISEKIMESNTVSFLFQALLLFVVSGAIYLLKEAKDIHNRAKESLQSALHIAESNSFTLLSKNLSSSLYFLVVSLRQNIQAQDNSNSITIVRDCYQQFRRTYDLAHSQRMIIHPKVLEYIKSMFQNIDAQLKALTDVVEEEWISDLQKRNQYCLDLILETEEDFKKFYKENIDKLKTN